MSDNEYNEIQIAKFTNLNISAAPARPRPKPLWIETGLYGSTGLRRQVMALGQKALAPAVARSVCAPECQGAS